MNTRFFQIVGAVCFFTLLYGWTHSKNDVSNFAYLLGSNLVSGLVLWALVYSFCCKNRSFQTGLASFTLIFSSMMGSSYIGYYKNKQNAEVMFAELGAQIERVESSLSAENIEDIETGSPTIKSKGEMGQLEYFIKTVTNRDIELQRDYLRELDAIGWNDILDPTKYMDGQFFYEADVILKQAKGIVAKYETKTVEGFDFYQSVIDELDLSASTKRSLQSGFDKKKGEKLALIRSMWKLEMEVIEQAEKMISVLDSGGGWEIDDGMVMFYKDEDLSVYNKAWARLQEVVKEQEVLKEQHLAKARDFFSQKNG